jgi:UDP-glucose 4-epimerase
MVLVTGGAGYISGVTIELLRECGEGAVVLDNLSQGHRAVVPVDVPFYQGDIRDGELVTYIAPEHQIESGIHVAAVVYIGESVADVKADVAEAVEASERECND